MKTPNIMCITILEYDQVYNDIKNESVPHASIIL